MLCTYLVLKLIQFVFGGTTGFQDTYPNLRDRLLQYEPALLIVAFLMTVPLSLWSGWYYPRAYKRSFEYAVDCYGKLRASTHLADVYYRLDAYKIYTKVDGLKNYAFNNADWLRLDGAFVNQALDGRMAAYTSRYVGLTRHSDLSAIEDQTRAIKRCLQDPFL